MNTRRHKVFVSYHHENDQYYRNKFENLFDRNFNIMISKSVAMGDIDQNRSTEYVRQKIRDDYIADATVIVVLVGEQTWQRKHVDWEIYSGLRDTKNNPRCGLLGILLPTYPRSSQDKYNRHTIPPRLHDNKKCEFARIHNWTDDPQDVENWIHHAFDNRDDRNKPPDLSRPMFGQNRTGSCWS